MEGRECKDFAHEAFRRYLCINNRRMGDHTGSIHQLCELPCWIRYKQPRRNKAVSGRKKFRASKSHLTSLVAPEPVRRFDMLEICDW